MDNYIYKYGKRLRRGYTTGSCAAAAAKAAAAALLGGKFPDSAVLITPKGIPLSLDISDAYISDNGAVCAVRKDGGDDPDATDGLLIYARAEKSTHGIEIHGGEGVGIVTKAGLDQPVGAAAINSVPRKMITEAVAEECAANNYTGGIKITIFVPGGARAAEKTYNPRMGITGGISIIGTTGIVEPMSNDAIIATMRTEMKMRRAEGIKNLVLTIGNYGSGFLKTHMPFAAGKCVTCSNFIGEAIDTAAELGFGGALIVGHIGKLVKLGAGIMNTHSSRGDARMDVLVTCALMAGAEIEALREIPGCATADAALSIIKDAGILDKTSKILMSRIRYYLGLRANGNIKTGALVFSDKFGVIGQTPEAAEMIQKITEEYNG